MEYICRRKKSRWSGDTKWGKKSKAPSILSGTQRTVVRGLQALEGVSADSEEGESVSVAVEHLQLRERPDIQLP